MGSRRAEVLRRACAAGAALVVQVLGAVVGLGTAVLVLAPAGRVTSWSDVSPAAAAVATAAGAALLLVGAVLAAADRRDAMGPVSVLAGAAWVAPVWAGWETGPVPVRTAALLLAPFLVPALLHLVVLGLRPAGREGRRAVLAVYALVGGLVAARALTHDPYRDRQCWLACGEEANPLLLLPDNGTARAAAAALLLLSLPVALGAATATLRRLPAGSGRSLVLLVSVPATAALLAGAAAAVLQLRDPGSPPAPGAGAAIHLVHATALLALACGAGWVWARSGLARARVAALARELGTAPGPGGLETHLSRSLRDRTLRVHYWSPGSGTYLDSDGTEVAAAPTAGALPGTTTRVVRGEVPVALVRHDPATVSQRTLTRELGSASRLVLDNERLRAERLAQRRELRLSRSRVAAAADEHRAGLERDLHDGAQQRLLAATYELRLARADAEAAGEHRQAERLADLVGAATAALGGLRDFAHGVFPAVLDEAGLEEALVSLAETAPVPVEVDWTAVARRRDPSVERTVYLVVRAAVMSAARSSPVPHGTVTVRAREEEAGLVVELDGTGGTDLAWVADRVAAAGGTLEPSPRATLRLVVP